MSKKAFNVRNKGFSLAETAVAASLIALVFSMATTAVLTVSAAERRSGEVRFFIGETENFLECYKMGGASGFFENARLLLPEDAEITAGYGENERYEYVVCYDGEKKITAVRTLPFGKEMPEEYRSTVKYFLFITIDKGFFSLAENSEGDTIFTLKKRYRSRFDL